MSNKKDKPKPEIKQFKELTDTEKQLVFFEWLNFTGMRLILEAFCSKVFAEHQQGQDDFSYKFVSGLGVELDIRYKRKIIQS